MDLSVLLSGDALVSLVTLTAMEIVLGIDNVVFIAILVGRLPAAQQALRPPARPHPRPRHPDRPAPHAISWMMGLTEPLFTVLGRAQVSGRDLILLGGGLFLIAKATWEIYDKLEAEHAAPGRRRAARQVHSGCSRRSCCSTSSSRSIPSSPRSAWPTTSRSW